MISSLIYETVDFMYTVGRISFHSIKGIYSWYFEKETIEQLKIRLLEERIYELEAHKLTFKNLR